MRLIDADALTKTLEKLWNIHDDQDFCNKDVWREIENAQTVEPERKSGEWLEKEVLDNADYEIPEWQSEKCSVCGKYHTTPYMYNFTIYKYCPNCGAKMTEGEK